MKSGARLDGPVLEEIVNAVLLDYEKRFPYLIGLYGDSLDGKSNVEPYIEALDRCEIPFVLRSPVNLSGSIVQGIGLWFFTSPELRLASGRLLWEVGKYRYGQYLKRIA